MRNAIALISAGLDSTVSLALAREAGSQIRLGLAFDYGQKAAAAEWRQAQVIAALYDIPLQKIELPWLGQITQSALSSSSEQALPQVAIEDLDKVIAVTLDSANKVWVPNRNGLMLNIAACFADAAGDQEIITGFNAEEAATFPDNTPQFSEAINRSLAFSTQSQSRVISYVQHLNKMEIVQEALRLSVPLQSLWSCYLSGESHCGSCESCSRLKRGLQAHQQAEIITTLFGANHA